MTREMRMHNILTNRWFEANHSFLQTVCRLVNEDKMIWQFYFNGTDCEHVAAYNGKEYRLNCCDPKKRRLFIDDVEIDINNNEAGILCQEITNQRVRLDMIKRAEILEKATSSLKGESPIHVKFKIGE